MVLRDAATSRATADRRDREHRQHRRKVLAGPNIVSRGFTFDQSGDRDGVLDEVRREARSIIEEGADKGLTEWTAIREHIHKGLSIAPRSADDRSGRDEIRSAVALIAGVRAVRDAPAMSVWTDTAAFSQEPVGADRLTIITVPVLSAVFALCLAHRSDRRPSATTLSPSFAHPAGKDSLGEHLHAALVRRAPFGRSIISVGIAAHRHGVGSGRRLWRRSWSIQLRWGSWM